MADLPKELKAILENNGIKKENILFLRIAGVHLKRIANGSKKVEFRDITDYYLSRLQVNDRDGSFIRLKPITHILFQGGYNPDSPYMLIEMPEWYAVEKGFNSHTPQGDYLRKEAEEEGFGPEDEYIGLFLGKILYTQV